MLRRSRLLLVAISFALSCGSSSAAEGTKVREVVVVFKTHFDIGYTDMAANVVHRYRTTMIDQALDLCDRSRDLPAEKRFVWTIPGWPAAKILEDWPGQTDQRRRRLGQALTEGRFVVHGLPFTLHTELLDLEDLVSGLGWSSRLSRGLGLELPRDAKMTDVASHTWILPTLLHSAGVDFLHLGCNAACRSPELPRLFWWEGPDGSRLLTMYSAQGYGTGPVPPADWPYKTWLALIHTGDNHGPPTPKEVQAVLDTAAKQLPGVKVRIGRLSDFGDAILAERAEIPVVRGDMPDTWIHGPMCDPAGARTARNVRPLIPATESLHALLGLWGVSGPDPAAALATAAENSLLYGEHTWGGALYWITPYGKEVKWHYGDLWAKDRKEGRFKRLEASWEEHSDYIRKAQAATRPALDAELNALAAAVGEAGPRVVVYNPLPWRRDGVVSVPAGESSITALRPADGGEAVATEAVDGHLRFVARGVPAMGYRTYLPLKADFGPSPLKAGEAAGSLENDSFRVVIDPASGTIRSLVEKRSGELVDSSGPQQFGQLLYERFDADQVHAFLKAYVKIDADWPKSEIGKPNIPPAGEVPYRAASPTGGKLRTEATQVASSAVIELPAGGGVPFGVTTRVTLYRDLPCVDLELTLHDKPADPWPEAGWICLPVKAGEPQFRLGRLGSVVDPARDLVPGAGHHLFAVSSGLTVTGADGCGVGLCPMDHPLVSLDHPGLWQYSRAFVPKRPAVFVNLFNNQWTTNFRMWNEGTWTSRVRIWAVDGQAAAAALVRPGWESRLPLLAVRADGPGGKLAATQRGVELSREGVLVTYFGRNADGPGTVLRLWEQSGQTGPCTVRLPEGLDVKSVQPIDLRGRPAGDFIAVAKGEFTIPLRGFAPASVMMAGRDK